MHAHPLLPVTLKLAPLLPTNGAVVQFPDVRKATEAVIEIMNQGVGIRKPIPTPLSGIISLIIACAECVELCRSWSSRLILHSLEVVLHVLPVLCDQVSGDCDLLISANNFLIRKCSVYIDILEEMN